MRYINEDDLKAESQERFIRDSVADNTESPDLIEEKVIELVISYMSDRYDTAKVFDASEPIRNELLVDIIVKVMLYRIFRRNPARKVGTNTKEDNDWAMAQLQKINAGTTRLNLPKPTGTPEQPYSEFLTGNNSNTDFYI